MPSGMIVAAQPTANLFVAVSIMALQLSLESYLGFPSATCKDLRLVQYPKGSVPMSVTLAGIVIESKASQ